MLDEAEINNQRELLAAHQRTLAAYLRRLALVGTAYAPPEITNGIADARAHIQRIKATLRDAGASVEDHPDDEAPPPAPPLPAPSTPATQHNVSTDGGDYAGGNIDKRQGTTFIENSTIGTVIGRVDTLNIYSGISPSDLDEQPVYETLPPIDLPDLFPPAQRLIGRQQERAHLTALYDQIARTRRGKFVFLTGKPGHGRRALAHALAQDVRSRGGIVLFARFWPTARLDPNERDTLLDDDPLIPAEVADLEPSLAAAWPQAAEIAGRPWLRLLAQASQILGRPLTPRDEGLADTPESLSGILRRLPRSGAILVVIEGLDTAPSSWIVLLRCLEPEIADYLGVLVVATLDAGQPLTNLPPEQYTEALHLATTLHNEGHADLHWLGPVDAAEIGAYIGPAQPNIPRRLHDLTSGVPAIVESLWDTWKMEDVVAQDQNGIWQVVDSGRGWVFGDLRAFAYQLLRACLTPEAPLNLEQAEAVLACAALEGPTFTAQAVARALNLDPTAVLNLLDDYLLADEERPGLVAEVGFVPIPDLDLASCPNMYGFEYPYLWHLWSKYGVPERQRITLQRRLADALEAVYYGATDMIAEQLIALLEASGQAQRAAPYRARRGRDATITALRWQVVILEGLIRTDSDREKLARTDSDREKPARTSFDHYRLYKARIELSGMLFDSADYTEGAAQATAALKLARAVADKRREATASSLIGRHLTRLGNNHAARPYLEQALALSREVLGKRHPDTATNLNNLGLLLQAMGELKAARRCHKRALAINCKVLGEHHPHTATSLGCLGRLLQMMGDVAGARPYLEQALALSREVLGERHPDTASSLNHLGLLLRAMGDLPAARLYLEQALAIYRAALGERHPDTASSLNSLGVLLHAMGDLPAARLYLEQALAIQREVLGEMNHDTARSLNNLGALLRAMGDLPTARPYLEQALAIRREVLGEMHPDTALSLNSLGVLLHMMGDLPAAQSYYEQALAICVEQLGADHPRTRTVRANLARTNLAALDAPEQTHEQQIAEIKEQAEAAVAQALAGKDDQAHTALAAQLEVFAQWAEEGKAEGSPYLALAAHLRSLAAQLTRPEGEDGAG